MSYRAVGDFIRWTNEHPHVFTPAEYAIASKLAWHVNHHTQMAWPSLSRLCIEAGISKRAVAVSAVRKLEEAGFLSITSGGHMRANRYIWHDMDAATATETRHDAMPAVDPVETVETAQVAPVEAEHATPAAPAPAALEGTTTPAPTRRPATATPAAGESIRTRLKRRFSVIDADAKPAATTPTRHITGAPVKTSATPAATVVDTSRGGYLKSPRWLPEVTAMVTSGNPNQEKNQEENQTPLKAPNGGPRVATRGRSRP
ncbi:helix-turn-helix domain-containing protein [Nanchangia anserum]|uniref:helix-turn-helix domain-containing protein n=1 Tax=Nanchangia anserum TaxID=2692125 RepID=UPI00188318BF|nr:helix-turn-helix domain-containing protein [Nanchangia anserum]QOX82022.1 helix-turn-helix domain-containing protein [Nanchangia anserum]